MDPLNIHLCFKAVYGRKPKTISKTQTPCTKGDGNLPLETPGASGPAEHPYKSGVQRWLGDHRSQPSRGVAVTEKDAPQT